MKKTVIITAGGIGKRMGAKIPKQFLLVNEHPILYLTLKKFAQFDSEAQFIITLPQNWVNYWQDLITDLPLIKHTIVSGGKERYNSIKNALNICTGDFIAVHDGVRPFVSLKTIENTFSLAQQKGSAIPTIALKESIRKTTLNGSVALERKNYLSVQTPQVFSAKILKSAYQLPFSEKFTDDASIVEKAGNTIYTTNGNEENIKITTQLDLKLAKLLLDK